MKGKYKIVITQMKRGYVLLLITKQCIIESGGIFITR